MALRERASMKYWQYKRASGPYKRVYLLTKHQFRSGSPKNWPYKRVDLTSVALTSGLDCNESTSSLFCSLFCCQIEAMKCDLFAVTFCSSWAAGSSKCHVRLLLGFEGSFPHKTLALFLYFWRCFPLSAFRKSLVPSVQPKGSLAELADVFGRRPKCFGRN